MDFCLPILPPPALALLRFCQCVFVASIALQHSNSVAKKGFKSEQEKVFKKTSPAAPPLRITQLQNALRVRRIGKFFQLRPPLPRAAGLGAARGAPPSAGSPFPRCPRAAWQWGRAASQESPAGKGIFFFWKNQNTARGGDVEGQRQAALPSGAPGCPEAARCRVFTSPETHGWLSECF